MDAGCRAQSFLNVEHFKSIFYPKDSLSWELEQRASWCWFGKLLVKKSGN
jgi:hypothetical protein